MPSVTTVTEPAAFPEYDSNEGQSGATAMSLTSPSEGTLKDIQKEACGLLHVSVERTLKFDILSGAIDKNALWLERVEGLENAKRSMDEIAIKSPGRYFVFCGFSHTVVAQIDMSSEVPSEETAVQLSEVGRRE